ncbi:protein TPX2-like isoform X2 [Momordica charantia]|uniref:Protein TPX2-like isoform X2 n=1 Tax=Momordica charantia TaxID=3673 RepID=A0A6J1DZ66_MOMCH|nr:protein TPX2-like isoform X2 [Momordica charantia]
METDGEMDEVAEPFFGGEIDFDYEFDAAMYYDFTRPETKQETREAEDWFKFAGSYPPSPFVVKLNREEEFQAELTSIKLKDIQEIQEDSETSEINENNSGVNMKFSVKADLRRSSTLMKPTASYLAKQNQPRGIHSVPPLRRFQFSLGDSMEISSTRSSLNVSHATKRQKLEDGYFCNVPHLRRQTSLLHKVPKKVVHSEVNPAVTRIKSTIPKEPNLETANRAQRYRSKINTVASEHNQSNVSNFKARPLNRKILEAPTLLPPKKSIPQMPEFQVFHLKTSERALQQTYNVVNNPYVSTSRNENKCTRRPNSLHNTKQEKCIKAETCKNRPLDKILSHNEECDVFVNWKDGTTVSKIKRDLQTSYQLNYLTSSPFHRIVIGVTQNLTAKCICRTIARKRMSQASLIKSMRSLICFWHNLRCLFAK